MITVLLNPRAGSGGDEDLRNRLNRLFREAGADARITLLQPGTNPGEAAREAARTATAVVAAGGDGTVSAVSSALVGTKVPLGVLPLGTLNHFAKDLRLPTDLQQAVATIVAGRIAAIDVGRLNDRIFINNVSIGLYPNIVELREQLQRQGRRKFPAFVSAIGQVLWTYRGLAVALASDGDRWIGRTPFVFVGNNEYTVDGLHLGARDTLSKGKIVVYVTPRLRSRQLPMLLVRAMAGRALRSDSFKIFVTPRLDIAFPSRSRVRLWRSMES